MKTSNNQYRKVIESLKLLSLAFQEQKQCFPEFVDVPFEVLDTFNNAFLLLPNLIEDEQFSNHEISILIRLHNLINFTASNPVLKDLEEEQFSTNAEWNKLRELSKEALRLIGEPIEKPDLKYI